MALWADLQNLLRSRFLGCFDVVPHVINVSAVRVWPVSPLYILLARILPQSSRGEAANKFLATYSHDALGGIAAKPPRVFPCKVKLSLIIFLWGDSIS